MVVNKHKVKVVVVVLDSIGNIVDRTSSVACSCCNMWSIIVGSIDDPLDSRSTCIVVGSNWGLGSDLL